MELIWKMVELKLHASFNIIRRLCTVELNLKFLFIAECQHDKDRDIYCTMLVNMSQWMFQ